MRIADCGLRILKVGALILVIALVGGPGSMAAGAGENVTLMVGRSTIVDTGTPIARVSLTSPDVADALVTSTSELLINGKTPGTISMFVWDRAGAIRRYEVVVTRDLARLSEQMSEFFPGETIHVQSTGKHIVLSGSVTQKEVVEKAMSVAAGYVEKKDEVVSLLQISGAQSNQVLLRVRFMEVNRTALTELGASLYSDGFHNTIGSVSTQQFSTPFFDQNKAMVGQHQVFSDYLNLFLFDFKNNIGAVVKLLQSRGLLQSLAEPNLVAESGKEASFLAGGEYPVPIAQPNGGAVMVTVQYKEFGIRLNFTPTVNGDRVHLKVKPEVSALDFANAVTMSGFRIPALSTRRTETELELQNGQTFAIAGLLNNTVTKTLSKVPGIGDIPILGLLFQSQSAQKERSELVVMITPEILPNNSSGVTPQLPRGAEPFLPALEQKKSFEVPPPAFKGATPPAAAAAPAPAAQPQTTQEPTKFDRPDPADAAKTAMPAVTSQPQVVESEAPATRPLTKKELDTIAKARKQEAAAEAERQQKLKEEQKKLAEKQKVELEKQKVEQERQKKEEEKRAREQAELDKKQQKDMADLEAKLKAAQAAYDAAKPKKP